MDSVLIWVWIRPYSVYHTFGEGKHIRISYKNPCVGWGFPVNIIESNSDFLFIYKHEIFKMDRTQTVKIHYIWFTSKEKDSELQR